MGEKFNEWTRDEWEQARRRWAKDE